MTKTQKPLPPELRDGQYRGWDTEMMQRSRAPRGAVGARRIGRLSGLLSDKGRSVNSSTLLFPGPAGPAGPPGRPGSRASSG